VADRGLVITEPDQLSEASAKAKDSISDAATKAKAKVEEFGRSAVSKFDEGRAGAADALSSAASNLHDKAASFTAGQTAVDMAHTTADKIEATADYVRNHDMKQMLADVESVVKSHPGPSLLVAVAVGYLAGRAFRRD
jgi:ElaB/YqjD/DUF883 family membrane-anchored ribosome-binding protein